MAQKFYVDAQGTVLGSWDGGTDQNGNSIDHPDVPLGATEVPKPDSGSQVWNGTSWGAVPKETVITFDAFEARFTVQEWDDATDFVYATNTTTGLPKRRALVQGLARAQARNTVDLSDVKTNAFLDVLVSGGVITTTRKVQILTP